MNIKEIKEEIAQKGYSNKLITYKEFKMLYEPYKKQMDEKTFAQILGISIGCYRYIKNNNGKTTILKKEKITEKRKQQIIKELIKNGNKNRLITYEEFKKLYEKYKQEIDEKEFASLLGIDNKGYSTMSTNLKRRRRILKNQELREKIRNNLIKKGYSAKEITYEEFKKMHKQYKKEITEHRIC